ncbi:hypothetical protein Bequi_13430 [Brachybacterium sp. JHP9]|uniref:Uncharacterized protein n=1 Tax=Brachybacterium equifaecis TaxID=2910770 RepID=A0ABT0R351_9MICO|nr:hypothetical protein [Brachybacterium equifaecis]MCL6424366.1 hypothetical protein [Brachybacterium equifaecis]
MKGRTPRGSRGPARAGDQPRATDGRFSTWPSERADVTLGGDGAARALTEDYSQPSARGRLDGTARQLHGFGGVDVEPETTVLEGALTDSALSRLWGQMTPFEGHMHRLLATPSPQGTA